MDGTWGGAAVLGVLAQAIRTSPMMSSAWRYPILLAGAVGVEYLWGQQADWTKPFFQDAITLWCVAITTNSLINTAADKTGVLKEAP